MISRPAGDCDLPSESRLPPLLFREYRANDSIADGGFTNHTQNNTDSHGVVYQLIGFETMTAAVAEKKQLCFGQSKSIV